MELRTTLEQFDTLGVMMSGSGSTVFALVESQAQADQVKQQLRQKFPNPDLGIWTAKLISKGIQVVH
jgi:4-diphosphocytidyl-2-C-methyl-D-erythritol kinase